MNPTRPASGRLIPALLLLLASPAPAAEQPVPFSPGDYTFHPFGWRADHDGFVTTSAGSGSAELISAPMCRSVCMEADVSVSRATGGDDWNTATVAVVRDPRNFWHFGLVDPPDSAGRPNFFELSEMHDGVWNAQDRLELLHDESSGDPWKPGEHYRLRIKMGPGTIEGTAHDSTGRLLMRRIFNLASAPAVACGRPALRARGLAGRFTRIRASWDPDTAEAEARRRSPPYRSDSFVADLESEATGFFRVERHDGKWWAIDPLGRGFVPLGVDHVRYGGHWCESLGYSPYHRKMRELYPDENTWVRETASRLSSWGFNRLGGHASEPMVHQGLNYSRFVGVGTPMAELGDEFDITPNEGRPCSAFPNVFHPGFDAYCRHQADLACRPCAGDPWLFGYFLDNELAWWGRGDVDTGLFDAVMQKPAGHTAKLALREFLSRRYQGDAAKLNAAWQTDLPSFDEILRRDRIDGRNPQTVRADKRAFLALIADRYFSATTRAIRAIDPDHLILGCRFAGGHASEDVWAAAAKYCDVLSLNYYGNADLDRGIALDDDHSCRGEPLGVPFAEFARLARGKPLLVTEWSFIALDSGLPCTNGAGQRFHTQAERAEAAGIFAESLLRIPEVIGFDYFMWSDEPALGISSAFPENSNYGLVNGDNEIYQELTGALSTVLGKAGELHREGPAAIPAESAEAASCPTPAELLTRFADNPAGGRSKLAFRSDDTGFTIRNGRLTLRGPIGPGPVLTSMRLDDIELGRYHTTAHQLVGRPEWPQTNLATAARQIPSATLLKVDLTSRFKHGGPDDPRHPFEIVQRLHLLPDADWFMIELVSYRNTSPQPVELGGIYFQFFSALGGDAAGDQPASRDQVPRLWGRPPGDAWIDDASGAFLGVIAPRSAPLKALFWLNEHGGQHPDAHWPVGRILAPGETLAPDQPVYWIVTAGRGGHDEWNARLRMPGLD